MLQDNLAQQTAIETVYGPMILIACPGSGKTTTLIRRIHFMVAHEKIDPRNILMITFTKNAAEEMKSRYISFYYSNPGITFCTIHALCRAVIVKFSKTKYDVLTEREKNFFFSNKIKYDDRVNDLDDFLKNLVLDISVMKNKMLCAEFFEPTSTSDKDIFLDYYYSYEQYKRQRGMIDFDDMLVLALDILRANNEALSWIQNRYQYIQVDEYQDTNDIQKNIIYLIAAKHRNLAVVGDDDQSIYGFRGAKPEIMLNFRKDFPDAKEIYMEINYRSKTEIVKKADCLISENKCRFQKEFKAANTATGLVENNLSRTRKEELNKLIDQTNTLLSCGEDPNDIAILYRVNRQAESLFNLFIKEQIPFRCNEHVTSKYSHWMFRDILAYYQLSAKKGTQMDLQQILNHPNRYFYGSTFRDIEPDVTSLIEAIYSKKGMKEWQVKKGVSAAIQLFTDLECMGSMRPSDFLDYLYYQVGYFEYLVDYAKRTNEDISDIQDMWNDFCDEAKLYDSFEDWEKYIWMYEEALQNVNEQKEGIMLSTMHGSKGLEWKHVFIIDCVQGICPYKKAVLPDEIEEERRLFYVAMTRAKDSLYLYSYCSDRNKDANPSLFLSEIFR